MAQQRGRVPAWLSIIDQPSVLRVLATLHHHGPHAFHALCAYAAPGRANVTTRAICKLAAFGMLRTYGDAGTLDQPTPETIYCLTSRGDRFAQAWFELDKLITQHRTTRRWTS